MSMISDILYSRELVAKEKEEEERRLKEEYEELVKVAKKNGFNPPSRHNINKDKSEELTLAFFLNLLDGILETPGRILILTSNHPEKLDGALIRPGRIDITINFSNCSNETLIQMVRGFYENIDTNSDDWRIFLNALDGLEEYILTPAEVNKVLFNYYTDYSAGRLGHLIVRPGF